jgi:glycerol-3-phosphate dehydrogenase
MKRDIAHCKDRVFDVLVVGGGINGAAIAHLAALNGLKVCLLEKDDFACGTSSKSTKIVHGGLRYLENFEFSLVKEALRERTALINNAPHLVHPLGFIVPVYKGDARPFWMIKFGIFLYDFLCGKHLIKKRRTLTAAEIIHLVQGIKAEGLVGGVMYYDGQMDDARLVLENVLCAADKGAVVLNYAQVRSFLKETGKTVGVEALDRISNQAFKVRAKRIVAAVGVWTDFFLDKEHARAPLKVRPTKGVHIVYRGQVCDHAIVLATKSDKRIFFMIPWHGNSLIGTTDTDYSGDPDSVKVEDEDIEYLFNEARRVFPDVDFQNKDIISTFAGLRPLVYNEGAPSKVSRRHVVESSYSGVIYVYGGKYTTFRKIAEDALKMVTPKALIDTSVKFPLFGSGEITQSAKDIASTCALAVETVEYLMGVYGTRYQEILKLIEQEPELKEPIAKGTRAIKAQIVYAIEREFALQVEDIMERRLGLVYDDCDHSRCREVIKDFLKNHVTF